MRIVTASLVAALLPYPWRRSRLQRRLRQPARSGRVLGSNPFTDVSIPKTARQPGPFRSRQEMAPPVGSVAVVPAPDAAGVIGALKNGTADIGFLAHDETRAREVDFARRLS